MTDTYITAPELQAALPAVDVTDQVLTNIAIDAASRGIDAWCGQRFWLPSTVTARQYSPENESLCRPDPIATTTGLIVQTDTAGNGTFSTTLTITTDFLLRPTNAADETPVQPYTQIWLPTALFPLPYDGRPTVKVTAKFGWPAVPGDVKAAALLLARDLFKEMKDAPFSVAGTAEFGVLRIRQNTTAQRLLARYRRALVA